MTSKLFSLSPEGKEPEITISEAVDILQMVTEMKARWEKQDNWDKESFDAFCKDFRDYIVDLMKYGEK